eukprot:scaffold14725_cov67-Phaeocystis_antarctica.AAC.1
MLAGCPGRRRPAKLPLCVAFATVISQFSPGRTSPRTILRHRPRSPASPHPLVDLHAIFNPKLCDLRPHHSANVPARTDRRHRDYQAATRPNRSWPRQPGPTRSGARDHPSPACAGAARGF